MYIYVNKVYTYQNAINYSINLEEIKGIYRVIALELYKNRSRVVFLTMSLFA